MTLLEELDTEFGRIRIVESASGGCRTYYQNGCSHSEINAEGVSTCAYIHVMHGILKQSGAQRVLMIGCAGGTLAAMLHRLGREVTVVDINPHAFALAKRHFHMPEGIRCIASDGYAHLASSLRRYDAIAVDAFDGCGRVAEPFMQPQFLRLARRILPQNGMILMNVIVDHDHDRLADNIANQMSSAGLPAVLFDWAGGTDRNIIIAGGRNIAALRVDCDEKPAEIKYHLKGLEGRKPQSITKNWFRKMADCLVNLKSA